LSRSSLDSTPFCKAVLVNRAATSTTVWLWWMLTPIVICCATLQPVLATYRIRAR
jgi:hypothetical protein